jgi:DNA polymerase delta subunit 3
MKNLKKGKQPVVPVAGPSKLKQPPVPETKPSPKETIPGIDNPKAKPKASGKIDFFKAKPKEVKEVKKEIKKEEPAKKMFFTKAPSPVPSVASEKAELKPPKVCHTLF